MKLSVFLLALCFALPAVAQEQPKIPVRFTCECHDRVGMLFASQIRNLIASSPRYRLVEAVAPRGGSDWINAPEMHLDAISDDALGTGDYTALSVAITIGEDLFLTHRIQVCGLKAVHGCAADTLAGFDAGVEKVRQRAAVVLTKK